MVCHFDIVDTIYGGVNRLSGACIVVSGVTFERVAYRGDPSEHAVREGIHSGGRCASNGSR